jgi:GNAT superfamily N-acetyltransferase
MRRDPLFTLTPQADLAVCYAVDSLRYIEWGDTEMLEAVPLTRYVEAYQDCASIGFAYNTQPIGGMIWDGKEVHLAVLPEFHGQWAGNLLEGALDWLFALQPVIDVEVEVNNDKVIHFAHRNGWAQLRSDGKWATFRMMRQPSAIADPMAAPAPAPALEQAKGHRPQEHGSARPQ